MDLIYYLRKEFQYMSCKFVANNDIYAEDQLLVILRLFIYILVKTMEKWFKSYIVLPMTKEILNISKKQSKHIIFL